MSSDKIVYIPRRPEPRKMNIPYEVEPEVIEAEPVKVEEKEPVEIPKWLPISIVVLSIFAFLMFLGRSEDEPSIAQVQPTAAIDQPTLPASVPTVAMTAVPPTAVPTGPQIPSGIVLYWAPGQQAAETLSGPVSYQAVRRWGTNWVQVNLGSDRPWLWVSLNDYQFPGVDISSLPDEELIARQREQARQQAAQAPVYVPPVQQPVVQSAPTAVPTPADMQLAVIDEAQAEKRGIEDMGPEEVQNLAPTDGPLGDVAAGAGAGVGKGGVTGRNP